MNGIQSKFAGVVLAVVFNTTAFASATASVSLMGQAGLGPMIIAAQAGASNNDALLLLLDQFTALRGEMETLRGMVEEQANEIRRLQQDSMDRYSDLDLRLSSIFQEQYAPASAVVAPAPVAVTAPTTPVANTTAAAAATSAVTAAVVQSQLSAQPATSAPALAVGTSIQIGIMTEQQLYELALDSLLQAQQYQLSIDQFAQYLTQYPDGRFVTNAYYWQGQAYVNLSKFNEAKVAFETILTEYPDGRKIEDAMYSLGVVYHRLGDNTNARQMLQNVITRFPNTSAANLADIYMRSIN
jgi:tol-pal system protein YbgF